jgi:hypothetical protein
MTTIESKARHLHTYLCAQGDWVTGAKIRDDLGFCRKARKEARREAGADRIIWNNHGYKATAYATDAELYAARLALSAQKDAAFRGECNINNAILARVKARADRFCIDIEAIEAKMAANSDDVDLWDELKQKGLVAE